MIIRSRRDQRGALWARWFGLKTTSKPVVLGESDFALAMEKERSRCDRRDHEREFVLLIAYLDSNQASEKQILGLCEGLRSRLRITDEIGWRDEKLCVLLPETNREGGEKVANSLGKLSFDLDIKLEVEILVYPEDDRISSKSIELNEALEREESIDSGRESKSDPEEDSLSRKSFYACPSQPTPIWKRAIDVLGSLTALVVFSPILFVVAVAIKLDSRGPVFFRQRREGKDGRIFEILKFRTMRVGAELEQAELRSQENNEQDGPAFKLTNDPRVTGIGRYLRKVCLDELPQMYNVLIGDMSLVGPRPLPVGESYDSKIWHRRRLEVLPGLTCIWQVQGRRDIEFDEWMRMDLDYIRRRGILLDLRLLFQTALVVLLHRGSV